ncbi:UNVERIFIED_CONTAM: hypothetical protein FKN15_019985 [Acipenser sinensis]
MEIVNGVKVQSCTWNLRLKACKTLLLSDEYKYKDTNNLEMKCGYLRGEYIIQRDSLVRILQVHSPAWLCN